MSWRSAHADRSNTAHIVREDLVAPCRARAPDGQTLLYVDCHLVHDGSARRSRPCAIAAQRSACPADLRDARSLRAHQHREISEIPTRARGMVEQLATNTPPPAFACSGSTIRSRASSTSSARGRSPSPAVAGLRRQPHLHSRRRRRAGIRHRSSEVAHVLATQTLWQRKPKTLRIEVDGTLPPASRKDVILSIIARIGAAGPPSTSSNTPAAPSARCRWKAA